MSDLSDLYQEIVLDHNSRPRNFQKLDDAVCSSEGFNPICGDRVTLYIDLKDDRIENIGFDGTGCAISRASTSMMTEAVKGKSISEVHGIFDMFHRQVTSDNNDPAPEQTELGDLEAFSNIREYPSRVKCVILGWHTLRSALFGKNETVSTE